MYVPSHSRSVRSLVSFGASPSPHPPSANNRHPSAPHFNCVIVDNVEKPPLACKPGISSTTFAEDPQKQQQIRNGDPTVKIEVPWARVGVLEQRARSVVPNGIRIVIVADRVGAPAPIHPAVQGTMFWGKQTRSILFNSRGIEVARAGIGASRLPPCGCGQPQGPNCNSPLHARKTSRRQPGCLQSFWNLRA